MATKTLNTRIQLKYDTLAHWKEVENDFKPLKGEVCLVEIPQDSSSTVGQATPPALLMKVGDGDPAHTFKDLQWVSAKAADVYAWAKAAGVKVIDNSSTGTFVTGVSWGFDTDDNKNTITITRSNVAISDVTGLQAALNAKQDSLSFDGTYDATSNKVALQSTISTAINALDGTITGTPGAGKTLTALSQTDGKVTATFDAIEIAESQVTGLEDDLDEKADKVTGAVEGNFAGFDDEGNLTDSGKSADDFVASVSQGDASITIGGTATAPTVAVNIASTTDNLLKLATGGGLEVIAPSATVTGVKTGEKIIGLAGTELTSTLTINYDSTNRKIQLKGISDTLVSEIDATDFIKDGMLYGETLITATGSSQSVTIKSVTLPVTGLTEGHKYLVLCFSNNTATPQYTMEPIDVQDLVDVYTAGEGLELDEFEFSHSVPSGAYADKHIVTTQDTDGAGYFVSSVTTDKFGHTTAVEGDYVRIPIVLSDSTATTTGNGAVKVSIKDSRVLNPAEVSKFIVAGANDTHVAKETRDGNVDAIVISTSVPVKGIGYNDSAITPVNGIVDIGDDVDTAISTAIGTLDGVITGTAGAGKTLTALSQTDGIVSATFADISITGNNITSGVIKDITCGTNSGLKVTKANGVADIEVNGDSDFVFVFNCGSASVNTANPVT